MCNYLIGSCEKVFQDINNEYFLYIFGEIEWKFFFFFFGGGGGGGGGVLLLTRLVIVREETGMQSICQFKRLYVQYVFI